MSALETARRLRRAGPAEHYWYAQHMRARLFTRWVARSFGAFGERSIIWPGCALWGAARMRIGENVHIASGARLSTAEGGTLEIGSDSWLMGETMIHATQRIVLGRKVLIARNVTIVDYQYRFDDPERAVIDQGKRSAPVAIGDGAWLGAGAVVLAGVTIGRGAVVGAGSVVTKDVQDHQVVAGVPARPI